MPSFTIEDMSCGRCVSAIEAAVKEVDRAATVTANLETKRVDVASSADAATIKAALEAIGYDARPVAG